MAIGSLVHASNGSPQHHLHNKPDSADFLYSGQSAICAESNSVQLPVVLLGEDKLWVGLEENMVESNLAIQGSNQMASPHPSKQKLGNCINTRRYERIRNNSKNRSSVNMDKGVSLNNSIHTANIVNYNRITLEKA